MKEKWKPLPLNPAIMVSNLGNVTLNGLPKHIGRGGDKKLQFYVTNRRTGCLETVRLSRAVGQLFCRDFATDKRAVYRDGNKDNCAATNLRWASIREISFRPSGEKQGRSKATWAMVRQIRALDKPLNELAAQFDLCKETVRGIIKGRTWRPEDDPMRHTPKKIKWELVDWSKPTADIARELVVSVSHVSRSRKKYAPQTMLRRRIHPSVWECADWSESNEQLSQNLGISRVTVQRARLRCVKTTNHQPTPKL